MEKSLIKLLEKIGLKKRQAKIYLALLELGKGSVQDIADRSNIKRTSIYPQLEVLQKRGLLYQTKIDSHTYYIPEDPKQLIENLKDSVDDLSGKLETLSETPPEQRANVQFFDGSEGFKRIWSAIFASDQKEYLIITDPQEFLGFVEKKYIKHTIIKKKIENEIYSRQIIAFSEYAKDVIKSDAKENRTSKILPHTYKIPYTTIIFDDKVALISPMPENIIMIMNSPAYAKTQRSFFEALWESLPDQ